MGCVSLENPNLYNLETNSYLYPQYFEDVCFPPCQTHLRGWVLLSCISLKSFVSLIISYLSSRIYCFSIIKVLPICAKLCPSETLKRYVLREMNEPFTDSLCLYAHLQYCISCIKEKPNVDFTTTTSKYFWLQSWKHTRVLNMCQMHNRERGMISPKKKKSIPGK